ncbi:MAG: RNA-binding protein [Myxococcales bacterium]|nr:RNA-binding protein [Myxococcales bacterium]
MGTHAGRRTISSKVFVGNLSYSTTKEELVAALSESGEVVDAFLPTDRETGRPRGFAFVTFASPEQATACIGKFDGFSLGGRAISVNEAQERPSRGPARGPGREGPPGRVGSGRPPPGRGGPEVSTRRGPPRPSGAPPEPGTSLDGEWDEYRGADWREDGDGGSGGASDEAWKPAKRKRGKGSRRGLRAKKRSL